MLTLIFLTASYKDVKFKSQRGGVLRLFASIIIDKLSIIF